jgi:hypothetical protein
MKVTNRYNPARIIAFYALLFIVVDAQVQVDWAVKYESSGGENAAKAVDVDNDGHPLVVYEMNEYDISVDDDGAETIGENHWIGAVVIKMDSVSQEEIWRARIDCDSGERIADIAHNADNDVYVAGSSRSDLVVFHSDGTHFISLASTSIYTSWVVKYNMDGFAQWAARIDGTDEVTVKGTRP